MITDITRNVTPKSRHTRLHAKPAPRPGILSQRDLMKIVADIIG